MSEPCTAIAITLDPAHEGGFQDNPNDRANWTGGQVGVGQLVGTKYGITALDMPGTDIKNLTVEQATAYYLEHYWKPLYAQIESQAIANKLFDMGVLFGVGTAVKRLQEALGISADGVFGQGTLEATNSILPFVLLGRFNQELRNHAICVAASNPYDAHDLAGWLRRIDS